MSILNPPQKPTPAEKAASDLKNMTRQTFYYMVNAFNQGSRNFWNHPLASPEDIATALGTDAKEVFELHAKLGSLIGTVKPESINEGTSLVGKFTLNNDGSVTITQ